MDEKRKKKSSVLFLLSTIFQVNFYDFVVKPADKVPTIRIYSTGLGRVKFRKIAITAKLNWAASELVGNVEWSPAFAKFPLKMQISG